LCETGGVGGAETVVLNLARRLDPGRFESLVVLMRPGWLQTMLERIGVVPVVMASHRAYDVSFVWRLASLARKHRVDVIHAHLPDANAYACIAGACIRTPVVATFHGLLRSPQNVSRSAGLKLALVRRLATRVVAVSSTLRDELVHAAGFPPCKTRVIYNGVDWDAFDCVPDVAEKRLELGIKPDEQIVGIVANLRPAKGYLHFVRAAALVAADAPTVRFLIIGEEEPTIKAAMEKEIEKLRLGGRVIFLGARDDVPQLLHAMDVFALSSLSEGMSIATVEAMGAGVPVVVTRSGGPEEVVKDEETGLLVAPGDDRALAGGILRLLRDRDAARRMAEAGRRDARLRFDVHEMARQYAAVYEECVS
jgi:glycosyltransferase involved in cell wall biosynthesis